MGKMLVGQGEMRRNLAAEFLRDRRGNVMIMFGLLLLVLLTAGGIAVDFQRANMLRSEIQEASDGSLIAAVRFKAQHPSASDDDMTGIARKFFNHALKKRGEVNVASFKIVHDRAKSAYSLAIDASAQTLLLGVVGEKYARLNINSEAVLGKPPFIELAMALDTTGSMNAHGKLSTMKGAARDLVRSLFAHEDAEVKIGIVPFAQYANVGESQAGKSWLDASGAAWKGCVGSRAYPLNVSDSGYDVQKVPGVNGASCPDPLIALTNDEAALETMIGNLDGNGWTYIPAGLVWAWRMLTPGEPFAEGVAFSELSTNNGTKALVLMTDGENTRAPDYPTHNSADHLLANDLTVELCKNIKTQNIVVYTIAFEVLDVQVRKILEDCASSPTHYFNATDASALIAAFDAIATSLRNISLSK